MSDKPISVQFNGAKGLMYTDGLPDGVHVFIVFSNNISSDQSKAVESYLHRVFMEEHPKQHHSSAWNVIAVVVWVILIGLIVLVELAKLRQPTGHDEC